MEVKELATLLGLTESEAEMLKKRGEELDLDPASGQIHLLKRRKKETTQEGEKWVTSYNFQIGIEGFRLIADRGGNYDGQDPIQYVVLRDGKEVRTDVTWDTDKPIAAIAAVYRKNINRPFVAVAHYRDFVQTTTTGQTTSMWKKWSVMLSKCAEASAFRKGFSDLPIGEVYEPAELGAETIDGNGNGNGASKQPPWAAFDPKPAPEAQAAEAATNKPAETAVAVDQVDKPEKAGEADATATAAKPAETSTPAEKQTQTSAAPANGSVKMASKTQIDAIQKLGKKKGMTYDEMAFQDVTFEQAAKWIKDLNAAGTGKAAESGR